MAEVNQILLEQIDQNPSTIFRPGRVGVVDNCVEAAVGDHARSNRWYGVSSIPCA